MFSTPLIDFDSAFTCDVQLVSANIQLLKQKSTKFTEEDLRKFKEDIFKPITNGIEKRAKEKIEYIRKSVKDEDERDKKIAERKLELEENLAKYRVPEDLEKVLIGKTVYEAVFGLKVNYEKAAKYLHLN